LPAIQRNILYDQHFSIDQISEKHIHKIVSGIFSSAKLDPYRIDVELYLDILKSVSQHSMHDQPLIFSEENVFQDLKFKYSLEVVRAALNLLSLKSNEINRRYLIPEEVNKRNYFEKPFVYIEDQYIYVNPVLNNYGFYASILNLYVGNGVDGNIMGMAVEDFVENLFVDSGVLVHTNKKYKISKQVAKELSIQSQERECDFIIETKETIILVELKRKTLTSEARAGNSLKSAVDLSQSLLHALAQTGCHEYLLRRDGVINFDDGTNIELLNRNVERVALSLFGFFGVQDGAFVHQILGSLINAKIESDDESENKKVNKHITELRNQYKTSIFNKVYGGQMNPFFNCRFFSVPQLIEVLTNSTNNEEFKDELNRTRHVSTGCKDWFKDYQFIRTLKA